MDNILLEIGCEEIPAGYIEPALSFLSSTLIQKLSDARISHGKALTYGTPKRLAVEIQAVAPKQASLEMEVLGPPVKVGFTESGKPTVAAEKFAEKVHLQVDQLTVKETPKGQYLCASVVDRGQATVAILKTLLPDLILATPFPKIMKWADLRIQFARPIHTILALYGNKVIPFKLGSISSNRFVLGHRFMSPGKIKIAEPPEYGDAMRNAHVLVDMAERKKMVNKEISKIAKRLGGKVFPDNELADIVTNLVEYPVAVAGKFDPAFLELPDKVLITSMREHQKYFAVIDQNDKLMPCFIAVNNTHARDMDIVAKGHERVLRARLSDAQFFYRADLETPLDACVDKLKGVLFQAKLGTVYDKTLRVQKLAEFIGAEAGLNAGDIQMLSRCARLSKADLVTQMVVEFPKLQGTMGKVYALKSGEPEAVSIAIEEHYRPTFSGGQLPETLMGAILSIADKVDSLCGCFSVGLSPTGASDPYALRRQAIGVIQIMLNRNFSFSLAGIIETGLKIYDQFDADHIRNTAVSVQAFFQSRMSFLMAEQGFAKDSIAAVLSASSDHIPNVWNRVRALEGLKAAPDFEPLAIAFKRVANIVKKAAEGSLGQFSPRINASLFQDPSESTLYDAYQTIKKRVSRHLSQGDFALALRDMASLRDPVDAFFTAVLVMADDPNIRNNRLTLLERIGSLFDDIADFTKISN
ncbi:MAG: glycine--tRNA ligase subunit beta [Deltaproteobacteria bacterium]|nr:glycine--tRNA ligase subunit beta [Deltaproteobacteria bacterium]